MDETDSLFLQDADQAKELGWEGAAEDEASRRKKADSAKIKQTEKQISILSEKKQSDIRCTIFAQPVRLSADFVLPSYPKSPQQRDFLEKVLQDNFLFVDLSPEERGKFINATQQLIATKDSVIIQQGDVGDYFYVLQEGKVAFVQEKDGQKERVGTAESGDSFGELALLYNCRRAVSCIAASERVVLWKIERATFQYLMVHHAHDQHQRMRELVRSISLFEGLDGATVSRFVNSLTPVHWKQGDRIVQKGEEGNVFYVIEEGKVKVTDIGLGDSQVEDQVLGRGGWFGERALLTGEPRAANVTALSDVTTMAMDRVAFEKNMGPLRHLLERQMRKQALKALPMFSSSDVTDPEIDQLVDLTTEVCYRKGEQLAVAGQPYQMKLWIIRHGRLLVYGANQSDKIYNLQSGDYFGDKSIKGDPGRVASHTATCEEPLTCWVLTRHDIEDVIGDIQRLGQIAKYTKSRVVGTIRMKDLSKLKLLGQGAFGKVWLVSYKEKDNDGQNGSGRVASYALKAMSKAKIVDSKLEKAVVREKELLCLLNHPFIISLVASYQDEHNLYLLLPVVPGGELYEYLQKNKLQGRGLANDTAAFFAACIIEALGHFHQRKVAYRDLKLENVLIDEEGYGKIVDLGFAKVVEDKTYTLCGTPEYLAPEIISKFGPICTVAQSNFSLLTHALSLTCDAVSKGHDKAVDYWSFGVIVYELLVGQVSGQFVFDVLPLRFVTCVRPHDILPRRRLRFTPEVFLR
jgi:CRP-like cAMP-binding protein